MIALAATPAATPATTPATTPAADPPIAPARHAAARGGTAAGPLVSLAAVPISPLIPENVLDNWRHWWPNEAEAVAVDVRSRFAAALDAWGLTDVVRLAGGEVALVASARCSWGEVVLKVSPRVARESDVFAAEARALAIWAQAGVAPLVIGTRDDELTLLMERLRPGTSLEEAEPDPERVVAILGGLCPQVHQRVDPTAFCRLGEGAEAASWRHALAGTREADELEQLLEPSPRDRLLHTDLHCLNALRSGDVWAIIDPKPHVGDPHAEVFAFLYGPPLNCLPGGRAAARERVRELASVYAGAAGLEVDRVLVWLRLRALTMAAGLEQGSEQAHRLLHLVEALG